MMTKHIGDLDLSLTDEIRNYYIERNLKRPNIWEALGWATAELGEVYEVLMSMVGGWVRNNPEDHPQKTKEDLAEELGDVIFMLIAAGLEEGIDPIQALQNKMRRKLKEKVHYRVEGVIPLSDEDAQKLIKEFEEKDGHQS